MVLGAFVPLIVFIGYDLLLFRSVAGKGEALGFAGMVLIFWSWIIIPGLFIANALILRISWKSRFGVLIAGFVLPAIIGVGDYLFLYRE